jgi:hypothetical protein
MNFKGGSSFFVIFRINYIDLKMVYLHILLDNLEFVPVDA